MKNLTSQSNATHFNWGFSQNGSDRLKFSTSQLLRDQFLFFKAATLILVIILRNCEMTISKILEIKRWFERCIL